MVATIQRYRLASASSIAASSGETWLACRKLPPPGAPPAKAPCGGAKGPPPGRWPRPPPPPVPPRPKPAAGTGGPADGVAPPGEGEKGWGGGGDGPAKAAPRAPGAAQGAR